MILSPLLLTACLQTAVVSDEGGIVTVKGPRVAWGPGHDTRTDAAQEAADKYCESKGRGKAVFELGQVKLFNGDYNSYSCSVSHEQVMKNQEVLNRLSKIGSCIRENIPLLDDLTSDADSIAKAIGTVCSDKVHSFVDLYLQERATTNQFNYTFREAFVSSQNEKILPFVLTWRRLLQSGWDKSEEPTEEELPNKLYSI